MTDFKFPGNPQQIGRGSNREIDLTIDDSDLSTLDAMRWRSGVKLTGTTVSSSTAWGYHSGKRCLVVSSGIGNGWFSQFGLAPLIKKIANRGALALRLGVSRLMCSMAVGDLTGVTPNSDVGVDCLIGVPSGMSDLRTNNNTHLPGSSGWGVLLALDGFTWTFFVKQPDTPSGTFSEVFALPPDVQTALSSGEPSEVEFRVYDATASLEAKMELWINGLKILTRYWVGGSDPLLPPMGTAAAGVTGSVLVLQLRNTSTGPPSMFFYEPSLIQGPADAGTL